MTYCIAIGTQEGLVFCSDSRTNAGPDMIQTHSKMHVFRPASDRVFVILSAGNLATTQAIINQIEQDLEDHIPTNLQNCRKMVEAAQYIAKVSRIEQQKAHDSTVVSGVDTSATLIFGGQISGRDPANYMIYPAGNFIADSAETPFLQIGESKYGKPILDRILTRKTCLEDAARCAIVSMDSTVKANAAVGPPIEVLVYRTDSLMTDHYIKLDVDDDYLREIRRSWDAFLKAGFSSLPLFDWEQRSHPIYATHYLPPDSQNDTETADTRSNSQQPPMAQSPHLETHQLNKNVGTSDVQDQQ